MVDFIDPRAATSVEHVPYELRLDAAEGPLTIGYLANGFPDSENFLKAVAAQVERLLNAASAHWNKGNASIPAPDDMLDAIRGNCQAAIAAYGH